MGAPGEDIAVILVGYEDEMLKMLRNQNPGLSRRFDPANAVRFADFDNTSLLRILSVTAKSTDLTISYRLASRVVAVLAKRRVLPNFGNAGAVKTMLSAAKAKAISRIRSEGRSSAGGRLELVADDFGEALVVQDPMEALAGMYRMDKIIAEIESLRAATLVAERDGQPKPTLPNYVFTGNAGVGKTVTARRMAEIFHSLGLLAGDHVVETTAADLMGAYVGHASEHVADKMRDATGGDPVCGRGVSVCQQPVWRRGRDQDCVVSDGRGPCAWKDDCDSGGVQGEHGRDADAQPGVAASVPQGLAL